MVGFGSSLRLARRPGWEGAYLDYEALKLLLTQIEAVYEEEAHLQQRRREGRDLDVMFLETPPGFNSSQERPNPDARDYRDELFLVSDSDAAFEALMKYDYYSAEEEASDLEQQQQHQLEMEQAAMMHPNGSPNNNHTASMGSTATNNLHSIFGNNERDSRPDIITAASSTSTSAIPFSLGNSSSMYHDPYHAEEYADYDEDEDDSQDGRHNCVPSAWGLSSKKSTPKKTTPRLPRHRYRSKSSARDNQFLSPNGDSDFFVHHQATASDTFILDASASESQQEETDTRQSTQDTDGMSTLTSFSLTQPTNPNSILQKPFRRTLSSEKTSLLSAPSTPATGLFSFASQTVPVTPPPGDALIHPQNRPARTLQMPSMASLKGNNATKSFNLKSKAELAKKLEEERKQERRKRRQKRRQRAEKRKALERKVPRHIRTAHTKARDITERFLGLLRAECEKVMLFAQSRLGELADTAGDLRFPSMEEQHPTSSASHYHGPTTIGSQQSEAAPMSPRTQASYDYPLSDGGMHSSASSTSDDGPGGLFYWSDSSRDSIKSNQSGSPNVPRSLSAFRDSMRQGKHEASSSLADNKHPQRKASAKKKGGKNHDGFDSAKRHLDHFEKLRRNRPIFQRSGNVMGEDLLLLSAVDEADGFTAVGVELMHVLRFICVNLIAVRKICRKHDRLLMNRMLGGYYHHLKMVAAAEANGKWNGRASVAQSTQLPNQQLFQDEHVQNAQTLGGLLARESGDIFEPHHPAVIGQVNNYKLVGLYDANLQQLANSRTVQVISSCLVLALSEYEVSRTRANALATLNSTGSGLPAPRRGSGSRTVLRHKQQQHQMSVLTGRDSHAQAPMFQLDEEEGGAFDSEGEGGPPSTASSISLTRLRFTVTSIIALREAARRKKDMYSTYLSRGMLAFTGRAVVGEGLDGCSRETLDFLVSYNPDAALLMDPASLNDGLKQGMWSKRSMCSVMASSLAIATTPVDLPYAISSKSLHRQEKAVIKAINVLPKVKFLDVPDLFRSQRAKKSRTPVAVLEDDSFRSILRLNRSASLLYNMNYYIVHPTTITFVTAVGSPPAHSALVIGAPSLAALMSALLHCYVLSGDSKSKEPSKSVSSLRWLFLLAALLAVAGNVVHVYGVWMESMWLAVLGRFIMGFSCSEILHRNIVASLLPHNRVVVETAILVQTQVFGMLLGLMLGTLAEFLPYHVRGWGMRALSSSSWLMAFLWFLQLGFVCVFFNVEDGEAKERMEDNNAAEVEQLLAKYKPTVPSHHHDSDSSGSEHGDKDNDSSIVRTSLQLTYGATDDVVPDQAASDAVEVAIADKNKDKRKYRGKSRKRRMRTLKSFPSRLHRLLSYSVAVPVCLFILLFINFAQEVLFSSCPVILNRYFGWGGGRAGIFLSALTVAILPLHFICGHISRKFEERTVVKKSLVILIIGLLIMVNYGSVIKLAFQLKDLMTETAERQRETMYDWLLGIVQYFVGFSIAFLSLTSLDSSTLSLLSKVSPPRIRCSSVALQLGTIVSFVGMVARVVADLQILMIGLSHRLINTDLINSLVVPLLVASIIIAYFVRKHFFFLM